MNSRRKNTYRRTYNSTGATHAQGLLTNLTQRLAGERSNSEKNSWPGLGGVSRRAESWTRPAQNISQLRVDVGLLLAVITLLILGLVMVYSASYDYSQQWYGDSSTIFIRQLIWLALGSVIALLLSFFDYHWFRPLALIVMGITLLMLFAVLFMNQVLNGAARTLLGGSVQPSELAKVATIIYLSVWLYAKQNQLADMGFGLFPLAGILGLIGGMIILQPDLSAVVTICILGGLLFFLAGGDLKQILLLIIFAGFIGWSIVVVSPTGRTRLAEYFAGIKDVTLGSYHVQRSFEAFVNGGWLGVGIGNGTVKLTGLPVPPTDSIFAVIGEETGVLGSVFLIGLYCVFLWRGMTIARRAPDQLGSLLAAGLTLWICVEAFVNMAVMVNLLPFAGNALPFISAGGSSMVMSMVAVGILMNISRLSAKSRERNDGQNAWTTPFNMRGRNRRRSVSGAGGSSGNAS